MSESIEAKHNELIIHLLGTFRVQVGGRTTPASDWHRKPAHLIKLLALSPGRTRPRDEVLELLWPRVEPVAANNNFHRTLHAARHHLEPEMRHAGKSAYLELQRDSLLLNAPGGVWVDLDAFEQACARARLVREPSAFDMAIELYTGELLPDDRFEDWTAGGRDRARDLYFGVLFELAELHLGRHSVDAALPILERLVAVDPTHEPAQKLLMGLYAQAGQRVRALQRYRQLRDALARGLDAEPSAATQVLQREILQGQVPLLAGDQGDRPQVVSADKPAFDVAVNPSATVVLPAPLASFVGRERELDEVRRLLTTHRLVTLTGAGGVGKTRLAHQIAAQLASGLPDPNWVVDLATLADGNLVPSAVGASIGVREEPGREVAETLISFLRSRRGLLVLDNCDHLLGACGALAERVLPNCREIRILVTSRQPLGVAEEVPWHVPSLSMPDPDRPPSVQRAAGFDSVRLFLERAYWSRPGFGLTTDNVRDVIAVCRRLDGIPLAIELAAAWVKVLTPRQIAGRLDDAIGLLVGDSHVASSRHRTLRATLDWSHDLLNSAERAMFRRLSVFVGGWTLEAAEAVASGAGIELGAVLPLLARLVDRSLVVADEVGQQMRYRFLESVRQYSVAQLDKAGELLATEDQHRRWFLGLAEQAEPGLLGGQQQGWLDRLGAEHDNLTAAMRRYLAHGDAESAVRLGAALWRFWWVRGYLVEGRQSLQLALALPSADTVAPVWRANALNGLGNLAWSQGDHAAARVSLAESLALRRASGDSNAVARSLTNLGTVEYLHGDVASAAALYEESLALLRTTGDRHAVANSLNNLGVVVRDRGEIERATALFEEALRLRRDLADSDGEAKALANLGIVAGMQGNRHEARGHYAASLSLARAVGRQETIAYCLEGLAAMAGGTELTEAARLFGAAEVLRERLGWPLPPGDRVYHAQNVAALRARLGRVAFESAWALGRDLPVESVLAEATALADAQHGRESSGSAALTAREREIAELIESGLTNREIAQRLVTSPRTVDTHVGRILRKLGLMSRAEVTAARYAYVAQPG